MAIKLIRPSAVKRAVPVVFPASIAYALNTAVAYDRSSSSSTSSVIAMTGALEGLGGIVTRAIAATDSDYASTKSRTIMVDEMGLYEADIVTNAVTANFIGQLIDFASGSATALDPGVTTKGHFLVEKVIVTGAAGKVQGRIRRWDQLTTSA